MREQFPDQSSQKPAEFLTPEQMAEQKELVARLSISPGGQTTTNAPTSSENADTDLDLVSTAENVDLARQAVDSAHEEPTGPTQPETVTQHFARSIDEIKHPFAGRKPYSAERADQERPLTHYTRSGNILQILRFGIQSNNFKNRINALRPANPALDAVASTMSGMRIKQGGSYQGGDSISLDQYRDNLYIPPGNVSVLINPNIKVWGARPDERDGKSGYGHGIVAKNIEDDFEVGNPTAYQTELLAANVIPPRDIMAVVIPERTSILRGIADATRENAILYSQSKHRDPEAAKEDLLANCRLLASFSEGHSLEKEIDELASQVDSMQANDIARALRNLEAKALQGFIGESTELTEETLRAAIQEKFNIKFLVPEQ